MELNRRSLRLW